MIESRKVIVVTKEYDNNYIRYFKYEGEDSLKKVVERNWREYIEELRAENPTYPYYEQIVLKTKMDDNAYAVHDNEGGGDARIIQVVNFFESARLIEEI